MITSYKENGCAIYVERHAMSDNDIRAFMEKCPIRCVFYDKDNESLKRLSSLDDITNKFDFKRTYNARTYITFRLTVSNGETIQPTIDRRSGMVSFTTVPYDNNGTYEETFYVKVL